MIRHLLTRAAGAIFVLWLVATATFAMLTFIPADPARALVGPHGTERDVAAVRHQLCLDRPLLTQYACHVGRLARGDLGTSFRTGRPVGQLLLERAGPTAELALAAVLLGLLLGVPLGALGAAHHGRPADRWTSALTLLCQGAPAFFIGPLLVVGAAYRLGAFPIGGHGAAGVDRLWHLALPCLTLAIGGAATYARVARAELLDVLGRDYIRAARAKGLSPGRVLFGHALRNAALPLVALAGVDVGTLFGSAFVTETIFDWPGLGREAVLAIQNFDLPVILGIVTVGAAAVVAASLLADITCAFLDPRVGAP